MLLFSPLSKKIMWLDFDRLDGMINTLDLNGLGRVKFNFNGLYGVVLSPTKSNTKCS